MKKIIHIIYKTINYFHFFRHSFIFTAPNFPSVRISSLKFAVRAFFALGSSWNSRQFPTRLSRLLRVSENFKKYKHHHHHYHYRYIVTAIVKLLMALITDYIYINVGSSNDNMASIANSNIYTELNVPVILWPVFVKLL